MNLFFSWRKEGGGRKEGGRREEEGGREVEISMDGFLGLMTVFPQQHEADLLPQIWRDEAVRDLPLHDLI
ncbi:hypothetical protein F7725_015038 [Dissostichus mawsoni]|uniref:Uncharacterized protein n=1 Tax=Dissostichus mawsoni TaxID=36200 RepID=A0A7J5YHV0_DISMA|nr:hypothetical protein F7725_015038 [Dissostichus mawsoni]